MEEVGAQVAQPIFIHGALSSRFHESPLLARKRDYPYNNQAQSLHHQPRDLNHSSDPRANWNQNSWAWDSVRFIAKPVEAGALRIGSVAPELKKRGEDVAHKSVARDEDDESLTLNLGGGLKSLEEPISRPNKRVRSGSPGTNYPMCQVDDCTEDLSSAKDYHRRHKVCEGHSKAAKAIVGKQMQRFCQQCSRFHPLSEFDEGKRSCRRRLAGHNRRRRKTQAEDASSRVLSPGTKETNSSDTNLDVVNLLTAFVCAQGKIEDKSINSSPAPNEEQVLQILSKINGLALPTDVAAKLASFRNLHDAISSGQAPMDRSIKSKDAISSPSTMDLLTVLSATLLPQKGGQIPEFGKSKANNFSDQSADPKGPVAEINSVGGERSSSSYHSSDCHVQETRTNLPLQLFSSSPENCSPPNLPSSRKYFSSDSSNRTEERSRSPSSSPVVQRLFPMRSTTEEATRPEISIVREINGNANMNRERGHIVPLELFRDYDKGQERAPSQSSPYQTGYTSSSGSDHSRSSLSLDTQERTGRIMFKLFDKDPSHLPGALRSQIFNWLSNSPMEMESYIRPGCLVLSLYLSMPSTAWERLEENLLERLNALIQAPDSDLWKTGRFLVRTGRKFASHNDGKLNLIKSWRTSSPQLISVSPLALAVGQEISQLVLKGRNLLNHGTKIHCTYKGGYISKDVAELSCEKSMYDEIRITGSGINDIVEVLPSLGRCFIEVENGFKGDSFPLIIAEATICSEIRTLESELREEKNNSRDEALHFLNELGWLFQRRKDSSPPDPNYSLNRFKFLLTFSVERDWCYLIRKLLDILAESNLSGSIPTKESLEALSEVQLLNRAVRRGCTKMVELLINYAVFFPDASRTYIFPPNMAGPGGITPLHLAACTSGSTSIIDALTNDPQEIGLNSWSTLLDTNGRSAYEYAAMRNNHGYNDLVARKLSDRRNGQISVSIGGLEIEEQEKSQRAPPPQSIVRQRSSCARCSMISTKPYGTRMATANRTQGVLQQPYIHSMLVIAAVCVCVCLFLRGAPKVGLVAPFKWENLHYGPI